MVVVVVELVQGAGGAGWRRVLVVVEELLASGWVVEEGAGAGGWWSGVVAGGQESGEAMVRAGHIRCGRRDTRQGTCLGVAFWLWRIPWFSLHIDDNLFSVWAGMWRMCHSCPFA